MQPQKSYLIFATPRSGSYLLCEALTNTGLAGRPTEFFSLGVEQSLFSHWRLTAHEYQRYLEHVFDLATTPNGVFGAKIIGFTLDPWFAKLRTIPGYDPHLKPSELLDALFPDLHYIFITRRDKLRQAISYARAVQTNEWVRSKDAPRNASPLLPFHRPTIEQFLREIEWQEQAMQRYFADLGIKPFPVIYEDFVTTYEETAKDILQFLGVSYKAPLVFGERHIIKQADEVTEEWFERFHASSASL